MIETQLEVEPKKDRAIRPIGFGEHPGPEPYNASEIVAIGDSRFLFCDNNVGDGLFELRLAADGTMACPLVRRPFTGLGECEVDDLEGLTHAEIGGRRWLFASPSFSLKQRKRPRQKKSKRGKECASRSCLLRISLDRDGPLLAEAISGFRQWLVEQSPELGKFPRYLPDDGGLNVEGLAWCPVEQAIFLGVRTPVVGGKPLILKVRLQRKDGPWDLSNCEVLPPVHLEIEPDGDEQGIRSMEFDDSRQVLLIVLGNSTSESEAPFTLCSWDGNDQGRVDRFDRLRFHKKMKVEGVTHGQIAGRGAIVLVDDCGGYQVLWDDDPRLI